MKIDFLNQYWPFHAMHTTAVSINNSIEKSRHQPIGKYYLRLSKVSKICHRGKPGKRIIAADITPCKRNVLTVQQTARFMQTCALPQKSSKSEACV